MRSPDASRHSALDSTHIASSQTLARRLRAVREERSLTQRELGTQAGVDQSYISRLEQGDIESPGLLQVGAISRALEIDLWILAGGDHDAFDSELARIAAEASGNRSTIETLADLAGRAGAYLGNRVSMGENILIVGRAGSGKTRVAQAVARRMPGNVTYLTTDGDTRDGLPSIVEIPSNSLAPAITAASWASDGLMIDSLLGMSLQEVLRDAERVEQLVCVCSLPKQKGARIPTDEQVLQSAARRLQTDARTVVEVFDCMVRTDRAEDGDFSVKVLELGLKPTLDPVVGM